MKVNLMGGLGNQMFQYAFGRSLSLARNIPLFFDRSWFAGKPDFQSYTLDAYDGGSDGPLYTERGLPFDQNALSAPADSVFHGYWQTEKYFNADVVRKELSRPKGEPSDKMKRIAQDINTAPNSAFVHVRRGDYLSVENQQVHGCQNADYFFGGMRRIEERYETKFFVFSDDTTWCRQTFLGENVQVVDSNNREKHWDVWLMSLCSHAIISNSSFGWWGAWLNPKTERVVIAPKKWFLTKELDDRDIVPERWIKL